MSEHLSNTEQNMQNINERSDNTSKGDKKHKKDKRGKKDKKGKKDKNHKRDVNALESKPLISPPIKDSMNNMKNKKAIKRIFKEYQNVINSNIADIVMIDDSMDCFQIRFTPKGGHYKNQTLILELKPKHPSSIMSYPFKPPLIKLLTPIFHTNVSASGSICVDFIYNSHKWMPTYGFESIITSIILLMDEPEFTQGHYNNDASVLYRRCRNEKLFDQFDIKTQNYYQHFINGIGKSILNKFEVLYQALHPDRPPVGL